MEAISTSGLTKYYGKSRGIIDLHLAVEEGDFFGFIGPNGAGKSTTIRCLLGLISPTSGTAELLGQSIRDRAVRAEVGYMPSEAIFYSGMRVREIIRFAADLRGRDCSAEARRLCDRLELDPNRRIDELSLGNRKKVSIVCAMQHRPKLYILDEPTSGLDPLMQREFFSLLEERHAQGATVFLSSHVLGEIQRHCRRAAIIRGGRLAACDRVDKLLKGRAKRVTLSGVTQLPELSGVRDVQSVPDGLSFLYSGNMPELLRALSVLPLRDVTVAEPDLEEIFLHYYTDDAEEGEEK